MTLRTFRLAQPINVRATSETATIAVLTVLIVAVWFLILPLEIAVAIS